MLTLRHYIRWAIQTTPLYLPIVPILFIVLNINYVTEQCAALQVILDCKNRI